MGEIMIVVKQQINEFSIFLRVKNCSGTATGFPLI